MELSLKKKSKPNRKSKSKISFDKEVVTKDFAKKLISSEQEIPLKEDQINMITSVGEKRKGKRKKTKQGDGDSQNEVVAETNPTTKKKRKTQHDPDNDKNQLETQELDKLNESKSTNDTKKESVRALKRKKHAKLLEDKKMKLELELQQKALNYLSKWKHSKSEWKFEKLRQVWLQNNMFDGSKIPNEFWDTTIQYFSGAKGHSRQTVIDNAVKLIEDSEKSSEVNMDEDYQFRLKRARDIVQSLE